MQTLMQKQRAYIKRVEKLNKEFINVFPDEVAEMRARQHYETEAEMQAALEQEDWLGVGETLSDLWEIAYPE